MDYFRYGEMVNWMDSVDRSLNSIVRDVNTLEQFEKERAIFQVNYKDI